MTNDIVGAKTFGLDTCYYNGKRKVKTDDMHVDYEIYSISELLKILL